MELLANNLRTSLYFVMFIVLSANCTMNFHFDYALDELVHDKIETSFKGTEVLLFLSEDELMNYVPNNISNPMVLWNVDEGNCSIPNSEDIYYTNYVLLARNNTVALIETLLMSDFWKDGAKKRADIYYIFLFDDYNTTEIFEFLWENEITNVLLFKLQEKTCNDCHFVTYTYRPFTETSKCGQIIKPIIISNTSTFLPYKYEENLKYCTVNMSFIDKWLPKFIFYQPPYVLLIPILFLKERYHLNFVNFSTPFLDQANPLLGIMNIKKQIREKEYDGIIGVPYRHIEYLVVFDNEMELSNIIGYDQYIWIVSKPKKISNIEIVITVFQFSVTTLCLITTISFTIMWSLVSKYQKLQDRNLLSVLKITLGYSTKIPNSKILKMLLIFYTIYSQHMIYFFMGNFSSKLVIPQYEHGVKTMQELIESDIDLQIRPYERNYMKTIKNVYKTSIPQLKNETNLCENVYHNNEKKAYHHLRILHSNDHRCSQLTNFILDDVSPLLAASYVFRAGHPMLTLINRMIVMIHEHGFFIKLVYNKIPPIQNYIDKDMSKLTMKHFQTAFLALALGAILGFIMLILEKFYHYKRFALRRE